MFLGLNIIGRNITAYLSSIPFSAWGLSQGFGSMTLVPYVDLGYSVLRTNIEIYREGSGGLYSSLGLDGNVDISEKFQLGIGANYNIIFEELVFNYTGFIPDNFIPIEDEVIKSFSMNLNLVYNINND